MAFPHSPCGVTTRGVLDENYGEQGYETLVFANGERQYASGSPISPSRTVNGQSGGRSWESSEARTAVIPFFKQQVTIKASGSHTGGALGAVEIVSPRGAAPPLHVHEDEAFYVLDGEYTIYLGSKSLNAGPGALAFGPRGVAHGYVVHSSVGHHLSLTVPGGFEHFFEEVADIATPSASPPAVMQQLAAVATKYGVRLLGPPPAG